MDLPELSTVIPSAGVLGLLTLLIIHFVRQGSADRTQYTRQITALRESHDKQIESLITRHDRQIEDLRGQVTSLRTELESLRGELESERRARWHAEDEAAKWRRAVEGITHHDDQSS